MYVYQIYINILFALLIDVDDCLRLEWTRENGGQAVDTGKSCECQCAAGYTGEHCQGWYTRSGWVRLFPSLTQILSSDTNWSIYVFNSVLTKYYCFSLPHQNVLSEQRAPEQRIVLSFNKQLNYWNTKSENKILLIRPNQLFNLTLAIIRHVLHFYEKCLCL